MNVKSLVHSSRNVSWLYYSCYYFMAPHGREIQTGSLAPERSQLPLQAHLSLLCEAHVNPLLYFTYSLIVS